MPRRISGSRVPPRTMRQSSRPNGGKLFNQDYEEICRQCRADGSLFEDPCFPADNSSLYYENRPEVEVYWKRPHEMSRRLPVWMSDGFSRFDVVQGELGDCWLLATIASLTCNPRLLHRVVPPDQSFRKKDGYCGVFRFRMWYQGEWVEVVVDDRLPTYDLEYPQLLYMHSRERIEFWSALLEKAYAKLYGGYECLQGGNAVESLEDLTGGLGETLPLGERLGTGVIGLNLTPWERERNLWEVIIKSLERGGLLTCSMNPQSDSVDTRRSVEGVIFNHTHSITKAREVQLKDGTIERLLRVRNPWGNEQEWRGAWSDNAKEWCEVPDQLRRQLSLSFEEDGEFWMSLRDFTAHFTKIDLCNLDPLYIEDKSVDEGVTWNVTSYHKEWIRYVNAGGCINNPDLVWKNPQFRIRLDIPDDPGRDVCTVIVALMQKDRRRLLKEKQGFLNIGYVIYKLDPMQEGRPLDANFFRKTGPVARKGFTSSREVCGRHKLPVGSYVIIPSTFEPEQQGRFLLRIYTETPKKSRQLDERTEYYFDTVDSPDCVDGTNEELGEFIEHVGEEESIDAYKLLEILTLALKTDFEFSGFPIDVCRSMVAMYDTMMTGGLAPEEFKALCGDLLSWKSAFENEDTEKKGCISSYSMRPVLSTLGFHVSNGTLQALILRHVNQSGLINFADFILSVVRLKTMLSKLEASGIQDLDNILPSMLYS